MRYTLGLAACFSVPIAIIVALVAMALLEDRLADVGIPLTPVLLLAAACCVLGAGVVGAAWYLIEEGREEDRRRVRQRAAQAFERELRSRSDGHSTRDKGRVPTGGPRKG